MNELLKPWLIRRNSISLLPLEKVTREGDIFRWIEIDSLFSASVSEKYIQGFYMLELTVKNTSSSMDSEFCINGSSSKPILVQLPIKSNGTFKRICYLPEKVESITWQPSQCSGSLESVDLVLKKVTKGFAISRMVRKLKLNKFKGNLNNLLLAYEKRFDTRSPTSDHPLDSIVLGGDAYVYLARDGLSCLNRSSKHMSKDDEAWVEEHEAIAFVRTNDGQLIRLEE